MTDILVKLAAPFPPSSISWRVGATTQDKSRGLALAFIDARDVQDRLDEVCGVYWQVKHHHAGGEKLACEIGIKIEDEWIWRGDGAGATDVEAEKGSFSDSFKRAAVRWGIGRYLYDIASPWVELEARGKSHVIADRELVRLRSILAGGPVPTNTPAPKSPQPQSNRDVLAAAYQRIRHAIEIADKPSLVDEIVKVNADDLQKIKGHSRNAYATIMELARDRRNQLSGVTVRSEIVA